MNWQSIDPVLRVGLLAGSLCYLGVIFWLLKKKKLTVRYSIIWLFSAFVLLVFAIFPYVVLVLTDLLGMAVPVNLVFLLVLAFILLLLLSLPSTTPCWSAACVNWSSSWAAPAAPAARPARTVRTARPDRNNDTGGPLAWISSLWHSFYFWWACVRCTMWCPARRGPPGFCAAATCFICTTPPTPPMWPC